MSSVDWATESLIAQLLVDDLEAALGSHKGKAAQGSPVPDGHLAVTEQLLVARSHLASLQDRGIARSLARALLRDQAQLDTFSSMNQGEEDDHLAALALSRGESFPAPTPSQCFLGGSPIHVPM
jgi:hypothetical protein